MRKINSYVVLALATLAMLVVAGCDTGSPAPGSRFAVGPVIFSDDFRHGSAQWVPELEKGGRVEVRDGKMEVDVPAGCTVWFKPELSGPVLIEYDATVIQAGGANDRVSDLNCFWMAQDARSPGNIFATPRSGKFEDYNQLLCYYVGQGGNTNTTTRFRRYIGSPDTRPLLPENDLSAPQYLLKPNVRQHVALVAWGDLIQYYRDGQKIFELVDPAPYTHGWFGVRTTFNHMVVENFTVRELSEKPSTAWQPTFNLSRHRMN